MSAQCGTCPLPENNRVPLRCARGYKMSRMSTLVLIIVSSLSAATLADPNSPTGTHGLLLIDKLGAHVRFFDPSTFKEIASLEVSVNPHDLAISPDHSTAYVPIYGDGVYGRNPHPGHEIAIIDLNAKKVVGTIDVSPYQAPHGIQIDRNGIIYVTCDLSRKLLVIDPKTRTVKDAIDTEGTGHWAAVLPDGSKAYVANKSDKLFVSVIDLKMRKIVARVPVTKGTQGITASPDGKHVLVSDDGSPELMVIDTATDKEAGRIVLEGNAKASFKPKYSPDGSKILVCNLGEGLVNIISASDPHKQFVVKVGKDPMGFGFSADGKTALVANHGDGTVSVVDLQAGRIVETFKAGTGIESLSYY
jgi:YVTN family beta-propeller protein